MRRVRLANNTMRMFITRAHHGKNSLPDSPHLRLEQIFPP